MEEIKTALQKTKNNIKRTLPILTGVVLLIGLVKAIVSPAMLTTIFTGNAVIDSIVGAVAGSILAGNPITSYILGGEFLKQGVNIAAVTAFLISWVTVGIVQFPAESVMFGKRFAVVRNMLAFISSIVIGAIVWLVM